MTKEIKNNKALRVFTFVLVSLTVFGVLTVFLKTDYAKLYKIWFVKKYRQIEKIYNSLNVDQKRKLHNLVIFGAEKTASEAKHILDIAGVKSKHSEQIVNTGSEVVKRVLKEIKKVSN